MSSARRRSLNVDAVTTTTTTTPVAADETLRKTRMTRSQSNTSVSSSPLSPSLSTSPPRRTLNTLIKKRKAHVTRPRPPASKHMVASRASAKEQIDRTSVASLKPSPSPTPQPKRYAKLILRPTSSSATAVAEQKQQTSYPASSSLSTTTGQTKPSAAVLQLIPAQSNGSSSLSIPDVPSLWHIPDAPLAGRSWQEEAMQRMQQWKQASFAECAKVARQWLRHMLFVHLMQGVFFPIRVSFTDMGSTPFAWLTDDDIIQGFNAFAHETGCMVQPTRSVSNDAYLIGCVISPKPTPALGSAAAAIHK